MNHRVETWPVISREKRDAPQVRSVKRSCRRCGMEGDKLVAGECRGSGPQD